MKDEGRRMKGKCGSDWGHALNAIFVGVGVCSSFLFDPSSFLCAADFSAIASTVEAAIGRQELPGCVIAVLHKGKVVYREAFGRRAVQPMPEPMTVDTIFDLASLTKPMATATSIMILVDQDKLKVRDKAAAYWPEFGGNGKADITLEQLLLHTSGLIADNPLSDYKDGPAKAMERIAALKPSAAPDQRWIYSDVNYIVLGEIVRRVSGQALEEFSRKQIFEPLKMTDTGFKPSEMLRPRCAPTQARDGHWMWGEVHDPRAFALGGVAGNAGLFGTADDLLLYARCLLRGGKPILESSTVEAFTRPREMPGGLRTIGWDVQTSHSANKGAFPLDKGFGHTGFTGASLWFDPASETAVVFLSNSVHPDGKGNVKKLRGDVATIVAKAVGYKVDLPRP
jgi:serine-type D-Ala-D-Ala carboxypeptidase